MCAGFHVVMMCNQCRYCVPVADKQPEVCARCGEPWFEATMTIAERQGRKWMQAWNAKDKLRRLNKYYAELKSDVERMAVLPFAPTEEVPRVTR